MIANYIVELSYLFLIWFILKINFSRLDCENLVPLFLEFASVDKFTILYSNVSTKHTRIPSHSQFLINFTHLPLKLILDEIRKILRKQAYKNITDLFKFALVLFTIKLKRTIHYTTIVQCCNSKSRLA